MYIQQPCKQLGHRALTRSRAVFVEWKLWPVLDVWGSLVLEARGNCVFFCFGGTGLHFGGPGRPRGLPCWRFSRLRSIFVRKGACGDGIMWQKHRKSRCFSKCPLFRSSRSREELFWVTLGAFRGDFWGILRTPELHSCTKMLAQS